MSTRKRIELEWNGESCSVLVTMDLIERIEVHLNLLRFTAEVNKGDFKLSHACKLITIILNAGGIEVSSDEVWDEVFDSGGINSKDVRDMTINILSAVFPDPKKKASRSSKQKEKST